MKAERIELNNMVYILFEKRILYKIFHVLLITCENRFPYRIRKLAKNIFVHILGYEGKKVMRWRWKWKYKAYSNR